MYNILICDDDVDIVNALKIYLCDADYNLFEAGNGIDAIDILNSNDIHLILMDIMMPKMDGLNALVEIRKFSNVPVIFISAKSEDADKIIGLDIGADDYITKPFNPAEVVARVRSHLRRYLQLGCGNKTNDILTIGNIEINDLSKSVAVDGQPVLLTPTEYEILKFLALNKGVVFSPKEIYTKIWGEQPLSSENTVAVHIRHIREKIEISPSEPRYIKAIWGHGYMMEDKR